jgi:crotonobetainyl-CoA:carnitine CoA-transferase CaiB-like acyl-CoA transferase
MPRPLDGITILEIGHQLAGPFCGMLLGDLGADVIKIERPAAGDHVRVFPPLINGQSANFAALNRNKRSIVIDLKQPEGIEIVKKLIAKSGALIENNRPGALARLGLGAEDARAINPTIVYVSLSGFGQSGPYSKRAGVNFIVESFAGSLSLTGEPDDIPMHPGIQTGDIMGGMFGTYAVLSGLINSLRHKEGQTLDVSLVDSLLSTAVWETTEFLNTGKVPPPLGHRHRMSTPSQFFEAGDGRHVAISATNDALFARFLTVLGLESHITDPRFRTHVLRKENEDYMISHDLFHWQTQSNTSEQSSTGQRYLRHREMGYTPLLFVRETKVLPSGLSAPYHFLGPCQYVSHTGSRPISITWRLKHPVPAGLYRSMARQIAV